jgi:hypothetical protein
MGGTNPCGAQKDWNHVGKKQKMMNSFLLASRVVEECVLIIESLIFLYVKILPITIHGPNA